MIRDEIVNNLTSEEVAAVRRKYYKEWRAKNKDKVKQHNENYWTKKALQLKEEQSKNSK